MPENPDPRVRFCHVRVTRVHANGGHNSRDVDILDRESWKRLCRGIKDTMLQGGEHHMRPLYKEDGPAESAPAPLKLRVEALEKGLQDALDAWKAVCGTYDWDPEHIVQFKDAAGLLKRGN